MGFNFPQRRGQVFTDLGDTSLMDKQLDPDALRILLIFTSGTTSAAERGYDLQYTILATNINAVAVATKADGRTGADYSGLPFSLHTNRPLVYFR